MNATRMNMLDFYSEYDQWRERHDGLQLRLSALCGYLQKLQKSVNADDCQKMHGELKEPFLSFMQDWQGYIRQEREMIFPIAAPASGDSFNPALFLRQDEQL